MVLKLKFAALPNPYAGDSPLIPGTRQNTFKLASDFLPYVCHGSSVTKTAPLTS